MLSFHPQRSGKKSTRFFHLKPSYGPASHARIRGQPPGQEAPLDRESDATEHVFDDKHESFLQICFMLEQVDNTDKGQRQRKLPHSAICHTQHVGFDGLLICLVDKPIECPFALNYGLGHFCKNPEMIGRFVELTNTKKQPLRGK